jgi:hypothetical protein
MVKARTEQEAALAEVLRVLEAEKTARIAAEVRQPPEPGHVDSDLTAL